MLEDVWIEIALIALAVGGALYVAFRAGRNPLASADNAVEFFADARAHLTSAAGWALLFRAQLEELRALDDDGEVTRDEIEFFVKSKVGLLPTGLFNSEVMIGLVELAFSEQGAGTLQWIVEMSGADATALEPVRRWVWGETDAAPPLPTQPADPHL